MQIDPASDRSMMASLHSGRTRMPWRRLVREVMRLAGDGAELVRHSEKPWASVTFSGARHNVCIAFNGAQAMDAADDFIVALPDHEFVIAGQIVAEAAITAVDQRALPEPIVTIEAELLLLDDI